MSTNPIFNAIVKKEPITKGWSEDQKYAVATSDGTKYLLRISPVSLYEVKQRLFAMTKQMAAMGIPMCVPIEFGVCSEGVYSIQSWIDGEDLETVLPLSSKSPLPEKEQYRLGHQAGRIASKIHTIPIPDPKEEWSVVFNRTIDETIHAYKSCGITFDGDHHIFTFIERNRRLLINRPQCFLAGDYNLLNMMVEHGNLTIIDFERFETGDPWNEFNGIVWSAIASPHFATGQIHGYFEGEPPATFFELMAVYIGILLLSLMSSWAVTSEFGRDVTMKLSQSVLKWFDSMLNPVPSWYMEQKEALGE